MSGVNDVRDISNWYTRFRESQYIEFTSSAKEQVVLDRSKYLKEVIAFLSRSILLKRAKAKSESKEIDLLSGDQEFINQKKRKDPAYEYFNLLTLKISF